MLASVIWAKITGNIIKISEKLTTADVRVIKWLTGLTVDADFDESSLLNDKWRDGIRQAR